MRKTERFKITGTSHYIDNVKKIISKNDDYSMKNSEIIENFAEYVDIPQYELESDRVELVPEPDNEYDKNAVRCEIGGVLVGYVKRESCSHVKKLLSSPDLKEVKRDRFLFGKVKRVCSDSEGELYVDVRTYNSPVFEIAIVTDDGQAAPEADNQIIYLDDSTPDIRSMLNVKDPSKRKFRVPIAVFIILLLLYAFMLLFAPIFSVIGIVIIILIMILHYRNNPKG